jgi:hypothetical protein
MAVAAALAVMVVTCAVSDTAQTPRLTAVVASDTQRTARKAVVRTSLKIRIMMTFRTSFLTVQISNQGVSAAAAFRHGLELWRQIGTAPCAGRQGHLLSAIARFDPQTIALEPDRITGLRDEMTPELMPFQPISPDSRAYSILGQRFITTLMPAASARAAASSWRTVSCIQITFGQGIERQGFLDNRRARHRRRGRCRPYRLHGNID